MKIAVTDLKDYNEAVLRYEWLDLEEYSTADEIGQFIYHFLAKRSKETGELHEEWFITDYEEFIDFGEYPSFDDIEQAVELCKEYDWEIVNAYYETFRTLEGLEDAYHGEHESEEDFAYDLAHEMYSKEDLGALESYINWEQFARELFLTDYSSERLSNYKIAVFSNF